VKSGPPGPGNSQFDLFPGGLSEYPSGSLHPTNLLWDNGSVVSLYDNAADGVSVLLSLYDNAADGVSVLLSLYDNAADGVSVLHIYLLFQVYFAICVMSKQL
jgi:hypothetical protein